MNQPSESTKEKIAQFFYETSIPRILESEAKKRGEKQHKSSPIIGQVKPGGKHGRGQNI